MSVSSENQDLLLCSIALEENFVAAQELENALRKWIVDPSQPLVDLLLQEGYLSTNGHQQLRRLVDQRLAEQGKHSSPTEIFETLPSGVRAALGDGPPTLRLSAAPPSTSVPRFHDLQLYAEGGLGEVYLAEDGQLQRMVAVKQIKKRWADDLDSRNRFLQEAQITGRLEHPGVVPVYTLGADDTGRPYYAMRFIQGHSLKDAIERYHSSSKAEQPRRLRLLELRKLLVRFQDVCHAMDYAHSRKIIHCDLKPSNVMLGSYGETFVVDWGLAKQLGSEESPQPKPSDPWATQLAADFKDTQMESSLGTPAYMSPEQATGKLDQLGPATDIYGLGVTLFELLTGQVPHPEKEVGIVLERISRGEVVKPSQRVDGVPPPLEAICLKAMAYQPSDRYISVRKLSDDIERWLADERVLAHQENWLERSGRWMRQHRTFVVTAVVAQMLLGAVLTIALLVWSNHYQQQRHQRELELQRQQLLGTSELEDADAGR